MTYSSNIWFARVPQLKWQRFPGSHNSTLSVSVPLLTHLHISYKYSWSWLSSATTSSGSFGNKSFITFANWWDHLAAPFQGVFEMNEALMFYHHTEEKKNKTEVHCHKEDTYSTPWDAQEVSWDMECSLWHLQHSCTVATNNHNILIPSIQLEESVNGNCNSHSMP